MRTQEELKCPKCQEDNLDFCDYHNYSLLGDCDVEIKCLNCNCRFLVTQKILYSNDSDILEEEKTALQQTL